MFDSQKYKPPFPYFGGKSTIANLVWARFGEVRNYVEPFFGSGAVLFLNPYWPHDWTETVNDKDGLLCNFWRAVQHDPDQVAHWADWPMNENDLHARHFWLVQRKESLQERLEGDPDFYDTKIAGWWVWGICCWIGGGWCSGSGPWVVVNGQLVNRNSTGMEEAKEGIKCKLPHLGDKGRGIHRQRLHLTYYQGVHHKRPHLTHNGIGIHRKTLASISCCETISQDLRKYFRVIADRLRRVRVCSGDWSRICGSIPTVGNGLTAVFLDPPYSAAAKRANELYRIEDLNVAHDVRKWCIENGDNPKLRIALCGYDGEHEMPDRWECVAWKTNGGYGNLGNSNGKQNKYRERIWFSPHCLKQEMVQHETMFTLI